MRDQKSSVTAGRAPLGASPALPTPHPTTAAAPAPESAVLKIVRRVQFLFISVSLVLLIRLRNTSGCPGWRAYRRHPGQNDNRTWVGGKAPATSPGSAQTARNRACARRTPPQ